MHPNHRDDGVPGMIDREEEALGRDFLPPSNTVEALVLAVRESLPRENPQQETV